MEEKPKDTDKKQEPWVIRNFSWLLLLFAVFLFGLNEFSDVRKINKKNETIKTLRAEIATEKKYKEEALKGYRWFRGLAEEAKKELNQICLEADPRYVKAEYIGQTDIEMEMIHWGCIYMYEETYSFVNCGDGDGIRTIAQSDFHPISKVRAGDKRLQFKGHHVSPDGGPPEWDCADIGYPNYPEKQ